MFAPAVTMMRDAARDVDAVLRRSFAASRFDQRGQPCAVLIFVRKASSVGQRADGVERAPGGP
jgi:hypothetical protein